MFHLLRGSSPTARWAVCAIAALLWLLLTQSAALAEDGAPGDSGHSAESNIGLGTMLVHIIGSVGIFWCILAPTSLMLLGLVVWLLLDLRGSAAVPAGFVDDFTDTVNKRKFKEAFDMAKEDNSYLGRVLTSGMGRLQYGLEDAREAAANTLDAIKSSKDRWNNYIAVIGTLGPLLGLVGTVYGMIQAFLALGATNSKEGLTQGISHALCVTLIGVMIAVPAIALNTFFRNRITQVTMDVGHVADDLLTQMYHNSKKAGPAPSTPAAAAPPPR
ncbi:MAG: MotA/TolQ/ExbB proton channel family protein [Fimbriiglobus sp.]|nr:MotA/TolQ/ExbB proton channel family protein [Fimbriiglobus sp.]